MRSLRGRLNVTFLALTILIAAGYFVLTLFSTQIYIQETMQRLNRSIAEQIVSETQFFENGKLTTSVLDGLFHTLMVINPSVEFYLADPQGKILAFDAPADRMVRMSISVAPIKTFIEQSDTALVLGDDPRHPSRTKPFSAAAIFENGEHRGYLYAILGGEDFENTSDRLERSHALRLTVAAGVIGLITVLGVGWLSFQWQTKKLRKLSDNVSAIEAQALEEEPSEDREATFGSGDEIDRLERTINNLSRRVSQQIAQLQTADAVRREMLLNISHDLRTPMTILQGYLETLQMKAASSLDDTNSAYLDRANSQCLQMNRLINEVFELATLESGERVLQLEQFCIGELMQDVAQKFILEAESDKICLNLDIAEDLPPVVADLALVERVLDNLIDNALRQTERGGTITLRAVDGNATILLEVCDTGVGIASEELPNIFNRFYRASNSVGSGSGLGLPIVQRILNLHGTSITAESEIEKGTCFFFELPVANRQSSAFR